MIKRLLYILLLLLALVGCETKILTDPQAQLLFSVDTLRFDTVFTGMGSTTKVVMVRNPQKEKLVIEQVSLSDGKYFDINLDGENDLSKLRQIEIMGKDSLFLFVRANIDPQDANSPVLIEDKIAFMVNSTLHYLPLEAYGQDVEILRNRIIRQDTVLQGARPYLVYDTLLAAGNLIIRDSTTFYMHDGACVICLGNLTAKGTRERPIRFMGDRIDKVLPEVPYSIVTGKWNGIYLLQFEQAKMRMNYTLDYVDIISGSIGLYCYAETPKKPARLKLSNSRIHNLAVYGMVLQNTDAEVYNSQISNCASYCVYLAGGKHVFVHNTIASHFQGMNIQPVSREDVAALYINDLNKSNTEEQMYFYNNILSGVRKNNLVVATALPSYYTGEFANNYLHNDTLNFVNAKDNVYYQADDKLFVQPFYNSSNHTGYDFRLDSLSVARGIADKALTKKYKLSLDKLGNPRPTDSEEVQPDAGCYQWVEEEAADL